MLVERTDSNRTATSRRTEELKQKTDRNQKHEKKHSQSNT